MAAAQAKAIITAYSTRFVRVRPGGKVTLNLDVNVFNKDLPES
jgi:hypothetical protein